MIRADQANLLRLTGGWPLKTRVQHPKVHERTDRAGYSWFFRAWVDLYQPDHSVKACRRYFGLGPSRGPNSIAKKEAEVERDKILMKLNTPTVQQALAKGPVLFGELARMYKESYLEREDQISRPTREKEQSHLNLHIIPKWGRHRLNEISPKEVEDWLYEAFTSWWMRHAVRHIMGRIYKKAEHWGYWEENKRTPIEKVRIGKKSLKRPRQILSIEQTARVLARLDDPYLLVIETCIATGARISEVLGLQWKHVDLCIGTIRIEQRVWHGDIGMPKTETSRRTLALGDLAARFKLRAAGCSATPDDWVFGQPRDPSNPLWDSSIRKELHKAARSEDCDFAGLGPHTFRRANISWRQVEGASAIEASKIAGHSDVDMTADYTFVDIERQQQTTIAIQKRLASFSSQLTNVGVSASGPPSTLPPQQLAESAGLKQVGRPAIKINAEYAVDAADPSPTPYLCSFAPFR
jgi:integrase